MTNLKNIRAIHSYHVHITDEEQEKAWRVGAEYGFKMEGAFARAYLLGKVFAAREAAYDKAQAKAAPAPSNVDEAFAQWIDAQAGEGAA